MRDGEIPALVRTFFPTTFKGYALEIGAADGHYLSNTLALEQAGWDVLCIEPNPYYYSKLKDTRRLHLNVACGAHNSNYQDLLIYSRPETGSENPVSALGGLDPTFIAKFCPDVSKPIPYKINVRTLDCCLEDIGFPRLDYLSLDVDGRELEILQGFDIRRWATTVAVVENPFKARGIYRYFRAAGFALAGRTPVNDIWVRKVAE